MREANGHRITAVHLDPVGIPQLNLFNSPGKFAQMRLPLWQIVRLDIACSKLVFYPIDTGGKKELHPGLQQAGCALGAQFFEKKASGFDIDEEYAGINGVFVGRVGSNADPDELMLFLVALQPAGNHFAMAEVEG